MLPIIGGGLAAAVGAFELGRRIVRSSKTQKIALRGKIGSGKTTLIHLLKGDVKELKKARRATASTPNEDSASVEYWFEAYKFYDTAGNECFNNKNGQVQEKCDMTLYVFNPLEFSQEILKELRANKNFTKLKAIGTRAGKLDDSKERDIRAQIATEGIELEFFELVEGIDTKEDCKKRKKELMKFIEGSRDDFC